MNKENPIIMPLEEFTGRITSGETLEEVCKDSIKKGRTIILHRPKEEVEKYRHKAFCDSMTKFLKLNK